MTVQAAVEGALKRIKCRYLRDPQSGTPVAPVQITKSSLLFFGIHSHEDPAQVLIEGELCRVPPQRRASVALHLAELDAKYEFVVFSMTNGIARADVSVDLTFCADPEALVALSFVRLVEAVHEEYAGILRICEKKRSSPSRAEKEALAIVNKLW